MKSPNERSGESSLCELRAILNSNLQNYGLPASLVKVGSPWDSIARDESSNSSDDTSATESTRLPIEDVDIFGRNPHRESLMIVVCKVCSMAIKANAFAHHLELRHNSLKSRVKKRKTVQKAVSLEATNGTDDNYLHEKCELSAENARVNSVEGSVNHSANAALNSVPFAYQTYSNANDSSWSANNNSLCSSFAIIKGNYGGHNLSNANKVLPASILKPSPPVGNNEVNNSGSGAKNPVGGQATTTTTFIKLGGKALGPGGSPRFTGSSNSVCSSLPITTVANKMYAIISSTSPPMIVSGALINQEALSNMKALVPEMQPAQSSAPPTPASKSEPASGVASAVLPPAAKKKRLVLCKDRDYDPDQHCGVQLPDMDRPCTRSLTCRTHLISHRRAVPGRSKSFDQLLAQYKNVRCIQDKRSSKKKASVAPSLLTTDSSSSMPALASSGGSKSPVVIPFLSVTPSASVEANKSYPKPGAVCKQSVSLLEPAKKRLKSDTLLARKAHPFTAGLKCDSDSADGSRAKVTHSDGPEGKSVGASRTVTAEHSQGGPTLKLSGETGAHFKLALVNNAGMPADKLMGDKGPKNIILLSNSSLGKCILSPNASKTANQMFIANANSASATILTPLHSILSLNKLDKKGFQLATSLPATAGHPGTTTGQSRQSAPPASHAGQCRDDQVTEQLVIERIKADLISSYESRDVNSQASLFYDSITVDENIKLDLDSDSSNIIPDDIFDIIESLENDTKLKEDSVAVASAVSPLPEVTPEVGVTQSTSGAFDAQLNSQCPVRMRIMKRKQRRSANQSFLVRQSRPASAEAEWSDSKGDPSCALSPASGRTGHRPNGLVLASLNKTISSLNLHNLYVSPSKMISKLWPIRTMAPISIKTPNTATVFLPVKVTFAKPVAKVSRATQKSGDSN